MSFLLEGPVKRRYYVIDLKIIGGGRPDNKLLAISTEVPMSKPKLTPQEAFTYWLTRADLDEATTAYENIRGIMALRRREERPIRRKTTRRTTTTTTGASNGGVHDTATGRQIGATVVDNHLGAVSE